MAIVKFAHDGTIPEDNGVHEITKNYLVHLPSEGRCEVDLTVCFGIDVLKRYVFRPGTLRDARKQIFQIGDRYFTVTYKAEHMLIGADMPEMKDVILDDIGWAVSWAGRQTKPPVIWGVDAVCENTFVGWDLETTGLRFEDPAGKIVTHVASDGRLSEDQLEWQEVILEDPNAIVAGHNLKFDYNWWQSRNREIKAMPHDTMVAAYLLDDNAMDNSLGFLSTRWLGWPWHKDLVDITDLENEDREKVLEYNALDSMASIEIAKMQLPMLAEQGLMPIFAFLMDLLPVFSRVERRGVYLDTVWTRAAALTVKEELDRYAAELGDVNPNSPKQVLDELKKRGINVPNTRKETIAALMSDDPFVIALAGYRKHKKLFEYFDRMPELIKFDGRVHTSYALAKSEWGGTVTGRTSSRDPNLQNIPALKMVRGCFRATPGYQWLDSDYSQLELRVVADLAVDKAMLDSFREGHDIHTATLSDMFNLDYDQVVDLLEKGGDLWKARRRAAKVVNFGILYGIGAAKLAGNLGVSVPEAQEYIDRWKAARPGVTDWLEKIENEAIDKGYVVAPTGQRRRLIGASRQSWTGWRKLRQATNFPVQHFASTCLLAAMLLVDEYFQKRKEEAHLLLNVHDQLAAEFKGNPEEIREEVEYRMIKGVPRLIEKHFGYKLIVPLAVDTHVGERWS